GLHPGGPGGTSPVRDCPNQSLDERMRQWSVRNGFDFLRLPLMKPIYRIMIRTETFRQSLRVDGAIEHPAQRRSIHNTAVNGKTDNPSRELIHHYQNPIRS